MEGGWEALAALIISTGSFLLICYLLFYTKRNIDRISFEIRTHSRGDPNGNGKESGTTRDG
jgi:hypothetical protein